jgi:hypothetical protein
MVVSAAHTPHPERLRSTPEPRRPYHLGVAVGLSAGVYAAALTAVTLVQIDTDRALAADRRPVADAIEVLREHHDGMADSLTAAWGVYDEATTRYGIVVKNAGALHAAVDRLGRQVAEIEGSRAPASVGGSVKLPPPPGKPSKVALSSNGSTNPAPPPASNGTSGASGKP